MDIGSDRGKYLKALFMSFWTDVIVNGLLFLSLTSKVDRIVDDRVEWLTFPLNAGHRPSWIIINVAINPLAEQPTPSPSHSFVPKRENPGFVSSFVVWYRRTYAARHNYRCRCTWRIVTQMFNLTRLEDQIFFNVVAFPIRWCEIFYRWGGCLCGLRSLKDII